MPTLYCDCVASFALSQLLFSKPPFLTSEDGYAVNLTLPRTVRLPPITILFLPTLLLLNGGANPAHIADFPVLAAVKRDAICRRGLQRIRGLDGLSHNADKGIDDIG
jgi:hypothetical protein